jgi:Galactose oxidase, central domain
MTKSLSLLVLIGSVYLLDACGGSSGSPVATHFSVTGPATASAGSSFSFTVVALDALNTEVGTYSGTVRFTSTDGQAALPVNSTFAGGQATFSATFKTVGSQTITATDMAKTTITGTTTSITVLAGPSGFSVTAPAIVIAGTALSLTVTAIDGSGNPVTDYLGRVQFTSTDGQAVLPSNSPLTSGTGTATFSVTLNTAGNQTITATDVVTATLTGTSNSIHVPAPASGFTVTGRMASARESHTATLLNDGKVLVVGGDAMHHFGCGGLPPPLYCLVPLASAELFDPASGSFTKTGTMALPRTLHTATLLGDGKVLVTGGDSRQGPSAPLATAEIFDISTGMFMPTGNMVSARAGHTATLLANGKVLVAGGSSEGGSPEDTAELFDPATGEFTATGSMETSRTNGTATLLKNGDVLVTGGDGASGNPVASAELFDPATGMFTPTGSMSVARAAHTATLLTSGAVLVTGGRSGNPTVTPTAELFDPATGAFVLTGSMESPRESHTATKLTDGKVLVTGGLGGTGYLYLSTAELFDPANGIFTPAGNMEIERFLHTATLLTNGAVLVTGGNSTRGDNTHYPNVLASAELFP